MMKIKHNHCHNHKINNPKIINYKNKSLKSNNNKSSVRKAETLTLINNQHKSYKIN